MKTIVVLLLILAGLLPCFSEQADPRSYTAGEIREIFEEEKNTDMGAVTFADWESFLVRLSVPLQKDLHILASTTASALIPGVGELINGDTFTGSVLLAGELMLTSLMFLGSYMLLPADLHFGSLDYFSGSISSVQTAWKNHSYMEFIPSVSFIIGGKIVKFVLRYFSAGHAHSLAVRNVESEGIRFEPRLFF